MERTARTGPFEAGLATRGAPSVSGAMEHLVSPTSPVGTVDGLATVIDHPPMPVPSADGPGPRGAPVPVAERPWRAPVVPDAPPIVEPRRPLVEAPQPDPTRRLAAVGAAPEPVDEIRSAPSSRPSGSVAPTLPTTPAARPTEPRPTSPRPTDSGSGTAAIPQPAPLPAVAPSSPSADASPTPVAVPAPIGDTIRTVGPRPDPAPADPAQDPSRPGPRRSGLGAPLPAVPSHARRDPQRAPRPDPVDHPSSPAPGPPTPRSPIPSAVRDAVARTTGGPVPDAPVRRGAGVGADAARLQARAFTSDRTVHLPDEAGPTDRGEGAALLAHELTHVAQQDALGEGRPPESTPAGQALETQAVQAESRVRHGSDSGSPPIAAPVAGHGRSTTAPSQGGPGPQRSPLDRLGELTSQPTPRLDRVAPSLPIPPAGPAGVTSLTDGLADLPALGGPTLGHPAERLGEADSTGSGRRALVGDGPEPALSSAANLGSAVASRPDLMPALDGAVPTEPGRGMGGGASMLDAVPTLARRGLGSDGAERGIGPGGLGTMAGRAGAVPPVDLPSLPVPTPIPRMPAMPGRGGASDIPGLDGLAPALDGLGRTGGTTQESPGGAGPLSTLPFAGRPDTAVLDRATSGSTDAPSDAGGAARSGIGGALGSATALADQVAPSGAGPVPTASAEGAGATEDAAPAAGGSVGDLDADDLDHMVERLMPRITSRLERELRRQRERAGRLTGL